jgi:O-antigen ligase
MQVVTNRILEKSTGFGSAKARIESLNVFLKIFPENPWFGVGPQTGIDVLQLLRGITTSIHVGYLSYLYFYGIIGAMFVFLTLFFLLKDSFEIGKKFLFWGSFYGLLSFCFANLTFSYFNFSEVGIVLAVVYMRYYKERAVKADTVQKADLAVSL